MNHATKEQIQAAEQTHWACACIKRKPIGRGYYIKLNPNTRKSCRACGSKRDDRQSRGVS